MPLRPIDPMELLNVRPLVIVGPSGVGKGTLISKIKASFTGGTAQQDHVFWGARMSGSPHPKAKSYPPPVSVLVDMIILGFTLWVPKLDGFSDFGGQLAFRICQSCPQRFTSRDTVVKHCKVLLHRVAAL